MNNVIPDTSRQTIKLLSGDTLEVTMISPLGATRVWNLPEDLLIHHAAYFSKINYLVTITDFEPDIFELFIEYMLYERYTVHSVNPSNSFPILDHAKAWVLGQYLSAYAFQDYAIRSLYAVLVPENDAYPNVSIGSDMVRYCCSNCSSDSRLVGLLRDCLIKYWHIQSVIAYNNSNDIEWGTIWNEYPDFRNTLLCYTNQSIEGRAGAINVIEGYLVADL